MKETCDGVRLVQKVNPTSLEGDRMKQCERCEKTKPASDFQQREDRVGLYAWCKSCCKAEGRLVETHHSRLQQETGYIR